MPRIRKKTSKRGTTHQREKVKHKVAEHRRKVKKQAKKDKAAGKVQKKSKKDPGIPNAFPYKDEILAEIEQKRREAVAEKQRRKAEKQAAKASSNDNGEEETQSQMSEDAGGEEDVDAGRNDGRGFDGVTSLKKQPIPLPRPPKSGPTVDDNEESMISAVPVYPGPSTLRQVLARAHVLMCVVDARDPEAGISEALVREAKEIGKDVMVVMNKADTVPRESLTEWLTYLRKTYTAIAFRVSSAFVPHPSQGPCAKKAKAMHRLDDALGAKALWSRLEDFARKNQGDELIVAVSGVTNTGKSSIINSLLGANVVPIYNPLSSAEVVKLPYTTTTAQEIVTSIPGSEDLKVRFIDTPGLEFARQEFSDDGERQDSRARDILVRCRGRIDKLKDPLFAVTHIISRAETQDLMLAYNLPAYPKGDTTAFLAGIARVNGLVKSRGVLDRAGAARIVLRDWGMGKLLRYTMPPSCSRTVSATVTSGSAEDRDEVLVALKTRKELRKAADVKLSEARQRRSVGISHVASWSSLSFPPISRLMVKQTFVQKVLRRPSRRYATTPAATAAASGTTTPAAMERSPRDFHFAKHELARIAAELQSDSPRSFHHHPNSTPQQDHGASASFLLDEPAHRDLVARAAEPSAPADSIGHHTTDEPTEYGTPDDQAELFYTPTTTPTTNSPTTAQSSPPQHPSDSQTPQQLSQTETPPVTPVTSAASSTASLGSTLVVPPDPIQYSTLRPGASPSTSTVTMHPVGPSSRRKRPLPPQRKLTYTDEDWAKDVRWLVAPQIANPSGKHKGKPANKRPFPSDPASRSAAAGASSSSVRYPYPSSASSQHLHPRAGLSKAHGHSKSKSASARSVVGMTVLVEVEEPSDEPNRQIPIPLPNRAAAPKRSQSLTSRPNNVPDRSSSCSPIPQSTRSKAPRLTRQRSSSLPSVIPTPDTATPKQLSRSPSQGHSRSSSYTGLSTALDPARRPDSTISRPMSYLSHATSSTSKSPYTSAPSNALDALAAHVSMSNVPDTLPSSGTRGFTGLVLPRVAPSPALKTSHASKPSWKSSLRGRPPSMMVSETVSVGLGLGDGVDLTRAGLAQTTMASVEVVRGIAGGPTRGDSKGGKGRGGIFGVGWFTGKDQRGKSGKEKGKTELEEAASSLGFTAYRTPPAYVGGNSLLVQVWAVGLDGTDARLVGVAPSVPGGPNPANVPYGIKAAKNGKRQKGRTPPVGYIPGRSFVGRVLEVGWEVREDSVRRGDWVVGLMGVQKCGALTEFVVVDRHRVHRVPQPHIPWRSPISADRPTSTKECAVDDRDTLVSHGPSLRSGQKSLTVDELALLPLSGISAYRAVRTLLPISREMGPTHRDHDTVQASPHPLMLPVGDGNSFPAGEAQNDVPRRAGDSRPRALVLRAHDGPGALAAQMLIQEGWSVWAHVPVPFALPGPSPRGPCEVGDEEDKELERRRAILWNIEERLRTWGAEEVIFVSVQATIGASSPSFHGIPRSPLSSSPSLSPSPFSTSSGSASHSGSSSSPYSRTHSSSPPTSLGEHYRQYSISSSTSSVPLPFLQPYTYTSLPLAPYDDEQGSVIALLSYLNKAGVRVDAILDTIGGRGVWEAGRDLLALPVRVGEGVSTWERERGEVEAQFTTLVGDAPDRIVASAGDNFRAGIRAFKRGGSGSGSKEYEHLLEREFGSLEVLSIKSKAKSHTKIKLRPRAVNYSWVSLTSDIDWEGDDVCDTLRAVLRLACEHGVRPTVGPLDFPPLSSWTANDKGKKKVASAGGEHIEDEVRGKVIPFENTPDVFIPGGVLECGGTIVSRIAG
ncbi:hypothetical protein ID866_2755 [Astraeus odoratus]|nr:hypothetical protein ID866_2755 [Astraeus odoratus]